MLIMLLSVSFLLFFFLVGFVLFLFLLVLHTIIMTFPFLFQT